MRIKVSFKIAKLPILYRHRIMALIKEILFRSNPEYKEHLYPDKSSFHSKRIKPFTFSVALPPNFVCKKEKFFLDEDVAVNDIVFYIPQNMNLFLFISSCDYEFIVNLYNGLLQMKEFDFDKSNGIKIIFDRVYLLNEKKITTDQVVFKTVSPILIENREGKPILPMTCNALLFNEQFNIIHDKILRDLREINGQKGSGLHKQLQFTPINGTLKKQVVKHTLKGFREKTGKPFMLLTTFSGCFKLKGDPADLQQLYQSGIGLRTGQGFGMVDVVKNLDQIC
ncbi:MAG: CRISPR-associated endoribonuclease Cas6 [Candidatus Omnitrophica bacterium]|nr:CRISPR-associated endoribonuclease Cas6 [Candidatus Omnitrophota bacterium]MCM8827952.1 CRISPR-associated endoribonuclease Cas6 [Candidatus Omnitrophota bacterium]